MISMRRPKWLSGWGKGKNSFEALLIIDIPDIKVVEASFDKNLVLFAVGTSQQPETAFSGEGSAERIIAEHRTQKDLEWRIFYDRTALPDFISNDRAMDLMAGMVAVSSGSTSVYDTDTIYIASGKRLSKGNAPVLLDYEMSKKIEEARKKK